MEELVLQLLLPWAGLGVAVVPVPSATWLSFLQILISSRISEEKRFTE